ncbi:MAG: hypothetical protein LCH44_10585 [Bacteroidetes bacterium]|nr:hypothetical protein [Bacteroidota bacterium]
MPRNKIIDLNNHLFAAIERLSDDEITGDALEAEIKKAAAITNVATSIIDSAKVQIEAMKLLQKSGYDVEPNSIPLLKD